MPGGNAWTINSKNHLVGLASSMRKDGSNVVKGHFHSQPMFISSARIAKITIDVWYINDSSSESSSPTDVQSQMQPRCIQDKSWIYLGWWISCGMIGTWDGKWLRLRMEMPLNLYWHKLLTQPATKSGFHKLCERIIKLVMGERNF